jgi:hypothetical protein
VKKCKTCGKNFTPKRSTAKYCSNAHRQKAHRQRQPETRGIEHVGMRKKIRRGLDAGGLDLTARNPEAANAYEEIESPAYAAGSCWQPRDGWWRDETMIDAAGVAPLGRQPDLVEELWRLVCRLEREQEESEIEKQVREVRLMFAYSCYRLTSAQYRELAEETARASVAWGVPEHVVTGLLADIYWIAYREDHLNALMVNDLRAAIRLEGEKTRAELQELGNLIVGTVIAREGHPAEAAEEILADEEGSGV